MQSAKCKIRIASLTALYVLRTHLFHRKRSPFPSKRKAIPPTASPTRGSCHEVTEEVFCFSTSSASLSLGTFPLRGRLLRGELIIYVNFNCTGFVRTHTQPPLQPPTTGGEQKLLLCHPERSEGSLQIKILHSVQNDIPDCR